MMLLQKKYCYNFLCHYLVFWWWQNCHNRYTTSDEKFVTIFICFRVNKVDTKVVYCYNFICHYLVFIVSIILSQISKVIVTIYFLITNCKVFNVNNVITKVLSSCGHFFKVVTTTLVTEVFVTGCDNFKVWSLLIKVTKNTTCSDNFHYH